MISWSKKSENVQTNDTSDLVKKNWLQHKNWRNWKEIPDHDKHITTQEFDKFLAAIFG